PEKVPRLENVGCLLDFLWLAKHALQESYYGWNGFMTVAHANEPKHDMSAFLPLPFIPMPAADPSTLYTALRFAGKRSDDYKHKTCVVTFDLPLFLKAMDIVNGCGGKLPFVVVRLGGFHLLMSFMGAVGMLVGGSGLADLWKEVYVKNRVDAMTGGHAYKRALRAHFLTQAALASLVLEKMQASEQISSVNIEKVRELYSKLDGTGRSFRQALKTECENNRTGGPWQQYFDQVEIMTKFVRAERTGDWRQHLHCVGLKLPHLAAACHLPYAKRAHLYPQEMQKLEAKMTVFEFEKFAESVGGFPFSSPKRLTGESGVT
ncbi:1-deoxy-D-xylulose 5-phosphate reductoisomerase, partial [Frankliniella fusca]